MWHHCPYRARNSTLELESLSKLTLNFALASDYTQLADHDADEKSIAADLLPSK